MSIPLWIAFALLILYLLRWIRAFQRNIAVAKATGLPYYVVLFYPYSPIFLIFNNGVLRICRWLTSGRLGDLSVSFQGLEWSWTLGYKAYQDAGDEAILIVAGGGIVCHLASAEAIHQVAFDRVSFPKALQMYGTLNIFGRNVVTTEGSVWKHHRRITAAPFSNRNNGLVWAESLNQANAMMTSYLSGDQISSKTVHTMSEDIMRLTLHIISKAGFGVSLLWPGQDHLEIVKHHDGLLQEQFEPAGHSMSFQHALSTILDNVLIILAMPPWLLKNLPFQRTKEAYHAFTEWTQYQRDLLERKKRLIKEGRPREELDLLGSLLIGAGMTNETLNESEPKSSNSPSKLLLSDDEIIGNIFIFLLAGHETTAHTLDYLLINLALDYPSQRRLQADLDSTLKDRSISDWTLEHDYTHLFDTFCGALINETLRLFPPAPVIPKRTSKTSPQVINIGGKMHTLPADIDVALDASCVHRNPNCWPRYDAADPDDLLKFKPARWMISSKEQQVAQALSDQTTQSVVEGPGGQVTSSALYRPQKGAYVPFSDGYRSCLGRQFAQVELVAMLALIFKTHSIELAVDSWASDEQVQAMGAKQRRELWDKAAKKARWLLHEGSSVRLTLTMCGGEAPIRFVKRGHERFGNL